VAKARDHLCSSVLNFFEQLFPVFHAELETHQSSLVSACLAELGLFNIVRTSVLVAVFLYVYYILKNYSNNVVFALVLVDDELFSCSAVGAHIFPVSIQFVLEAVD